MSWCFKRPVLKLIPLLIFSPEVEPFLIGFPRRSLGYYITVNKAYEKSMRKLTFIVKPPTPTTLTIQSLLLSSMNECCFSVVDVKKFSKKKQFGIPACID